MYRCACGLLLLLSLSNTTLADELKIEPLSEAPAGLSAEVSAALQETGFRIFDASGIICDVWIAKQIPLKPKFKPSLRVKYPLLPGQLVGAIRYPDDAQPTDFRGQPLKPGIYTLRYGLQPDDGNHLGTSDIRDFLVGCPPDKDASPARVEDVKKLFKLSAGSAGTTHPAIYLLLPQAQTPSDSPAIGFDGDKNLTILELTFAGKDGDASVSVPVRIVVRGKTEA